MDEWTERLSWLRKQGEFASFSKAAQAYGINYETYKKHANGERPLTQEAAETIARFHKISPGWLMFGEGTPEGESNVHLAGFISAGQEIVLFDDVGEAGEVVDATITGPDGNAFEVRGNSMFPLARHGDVIFVGPSQRDVTRFIGQECAIELEDGRRLFKVLERGSRPGLFDLHSYNEQTIRDVEVHRAGAFLGLKRRRS